MASSDAQDQRKQRKKLQNRLNQRAHRQREREQFGVCKTKPRRLFHVNSWRLDEHPTPEKALILTKPNNTSSKNLHHSTEESLEPKNAEFRVVKLQSRDEMLCECVVRRLQQFKLQPSPFPDHLLSLVHFNALRGLVENKSMLRTFTAHFTLGNLEKKQEMEEDYPGHAIIVPIQNGLSETLRPTALQSSVAHAKWIDIFPFARMRDNLIKWEACFDHAEFVEDIVGDMVNLTGFAKLKTPERPKVAWTTSYSEKGEEVEEVSPSRRGLILWGDAYNVESWEVTMGFARKWGWALEGCQELIAATNKWRRKRGEGPLIIRM